MGERLTKIEEGRASSLTKDEIGELRFNGGGLLVAFNSEKQEACCLVSKKLQELKNFIETELNSDPSKYPEVKLIGEEFFLEELASAVKQAGLVVRAQKEISESEPRSIFVYGDEARVRVEQIERNSTKPKIKLLIIDDSPLIHKAIRKLLANDTEIEIVGSVYHPKDAEKALIEFKPDVVTLDLNMPEETGVELLRRLFPRFKLPFILLTSYTREQGPMVFDALAAGAVDYIHKPGMSELGDLRSLMKAKIKAVCRASVDRIGRQLAKPAAPKQALSFRSEKVICIGTSTGGPEALRILFEQFPNEIPPVLVVQHIPPVFSNAMAERFDEMFSFDVKEAKDGDELRNNLVLIAPGGTQMKLLQLGGKLKVEVNDDPLMNHHKPSVDYLFYSVAQVLKDKAVGVILTGMGGDGAKGLLKMREAGAKTLSQDELTSVVFGMPKVAWEIGASEKQAPLDEMGFAIQRFL